MDPGISFKKLEALVAGAARAVSASSNRSWQLSVADAVQEVPRRHLQTELMNPVIGGLEAPISRRTRGY